jgi:hypothetical protein
MYLLICASPSEIPWQVQYALNPVRHVGRLDLDVEGLGHYVQALLGSWSDSAARYDSPLVWSVDHGGGDITTLMRQVVGHPVFGRLRADTDMPNARYLDGSLGKATVAELVAALAAQPPSLVVTSSHGMTGPLDDHVAMRRDLGALVDQAHALVTRDSLLARGWQPDGAVWFAQACCSAGADQPSAYEGLFASGSVVDDVLMAVAALGAVTSPLSRALLGAGKPLRAFIGQVEPTFNWTMSFPPNQQALTSDLEAAVYDGICSGLPIGLAMGRYYQPIGSLLINHGRALRQFNTSAGRAAATALDMALYSKVTAYDRASTVILGDPTVAIPLPTKADDG